MKFTVTDNNWNLFFIRFFFAILVGIIAIGGIAYTFLPENPEMYVVFVTLGVMGSVVAMSISW